jgi:hypothetical protein
VTVVPHRRRDGICRRTPSAQEKDLHYVQVLEQELEEVRTWRS